MEIKTDDGQYRCVNLEGYKALNKIYMFAVSRDLVSHNLYQQAMFQKGLIDEYELQLSLEMEAKEALILELDIMRANEKANQKKDKYQKIKNFGLWGTIIIEAGAIIVLGVANAR